MDSSVSLRINSPSVVQDTIDGEVVIVNLKSGSYYSLDGVGADIWSFLEQGNTVDQIVERMARKYDGSRSDIQKGVNTLVTELQGEELVVPARTKASLVSGEAKTEQSPTGSPRPRFLNPKLQKYTDMQDLLLLDPIHDVDDKGWPTIKTDKPQQ